MNFDIDIIALREKLRIVSSFTSHKTPMPILGNVKIDVSNSGIRLSCTNLETYIASKMVAVHDEDFSFTVNSQDLLNFIASLSGGATVQFDGKRMTLKCGAAKASFPVIDVKDFPVEPVSGVDKFTIPCADLIKAMDLVETSCLRGDENRPVLTCFNMVLEENLMILACTDGFRVSESKTPIVFSGSENILIPVSNLSAIKKLDGNVTVGMGNNFVSFASEDTVIYSINMSGVFPKYRAILPASFTNIVKIDSVSWMKAILKRCLSFAPEIVEMFVDSDGIKFSVETADKGKYEEKLPSFAVHLAEDYDFQIMVSPTMLLQTIETAEKLGNNPVLMSWNTMRSPVRYKVQDNDSWWNLIMPMVRK